MRVFVYEYACARSCRDPSIPASVRREGLAMRDAIASDFRAAGCDVLTLDNIEPTHERDAFSECLRQAEAAFIIAPEFDHILTTRCQWAEAAGVLLLNTPARVLAWITDKWEQFRHFRRCGVAVPETWLVPPARIDQVVRKPRWGAGSWQVRLLPSAKVADHSGALRESGPGAKVDTAGGNRLFGELGPAPAGETGAHFSSLTERGSSTGETTTAVGSGEVMVPNVSNHARTREPDFERGGRECAASGWLWQRYVRGIPASIACLCGETGFVVLRGAYQLLSEGEEFRYLGGELPLPRSLEDRARRLAEAALAHLPQLRGYVGLDLVLGADPTGSEDYVIELNARLTTSYLGQRQLCRRNLADLLIRLALGQPVPEPDWYPGSVRFLVATEG